MAGTGSEPSPPARAGWWQCRALTADGQPAFFAVVASPQYADGTRVELPVAEAEAQIAGRAAATARFGDDGRVVGLEIGPGTGSQLPALWFAEFREPAARPPAVSLVAFSGLGPSAGALLDPPALTNLPVRKQDQLGAVRWYPATGEVDQIYVQPQWRRHAVGSALIAAAATLSYARDWPRLWSDGQRTVLGEQFRNASSWRHRTADLTHTAPPMTPGEAEATRPP